MVDKIVPKPTNSIEQSLSTAVEMNAPFESSVVVSDTAVTVTLVIPREHVRLSQPDPKAPWFHGVNLCFSGLVSGWKLSGWSARDKDGNKTGRTGLWLGVRA
jgi:hypothetical protein